MEKVTEKNNASRRLVASMVRDIDGKMVRKDGKPLRTAICMPTVSNPKFGPPLNTNPKPNEAKTHEENPNIGKTQEECPKSVLESVHDKLTGWDDDDNNGIKSFANVVSASTPKSKLNFRTLFNEDKVEETDFVLPLAAVEVVKHKFDNTLKVMRDDEGVHYFKFDSPNGVDQTPSLSLAKDKVTKVPVWVKLHRVPVVAYYEDGLSLIASQVGTPLMLDVFTSAMCEEPWGRIGFARALIEVSAEKDLKENVIMAVPLENGEGYSKENIRVEYEWKPPTCIVVETTVEENNDGFMKVNNRKTKGKGPVNNQKKNATGFKVGNNQNLRYQPVKPKSGDKKSDDDQQDNGIKLKNLFKKLNDITVPVTYSSGGNEAENIFGDTSKVTQFTEDSDSENQKPRSGGGVLKKLDRIMGNMEFIDTFPGAYDVFQPYRISDHSPEVLKIPSLMIQNPKPFKFFNFLTFKCKFLDVVAEQWNVNTEGYHMFGVVTKMKALKKPLRKLLHSYGNLHERVNALRIELDKVKNALDRNPLDTNLRDEEAAYVSAFIDTKLDEERFLKQKSKIELLEVGDANSAFFHKSVKCRNQRSRIDSIRDAADCEVTGSLVAECFVNHYQQFLGTNLECDDLDSDAMFSIGDDKAPGPDGFTSTFFKKSWDLVGNDVCRAVREFFNNGQLLKEINHTFLALIPKVATPLKEVVSENQSAFIPGRRITNNILITQELMHNYHRDRGPPRCAFKVDIQKAYDMVDWKFLSNILNLFGFHKKMVKWIMACVSSASFSLRINGDIHGYFNGKRGLRKGDPISSYLFTLVMEVLTLIIKRRVRLSNMFRYHNRCKELELINVCFADNLFIFTRGEVHSARLIMEALNEFQKSSGLVPSIPKAILPLYKWRYSWILNIMSFAEGELPVKYFGVPLISSILLNKDCKILVEKVTVLVIPISIIQDIEQLMRGFIWCNGELKRGKAKVAWDIICLPKREGGLGIRSLKTYNIALMTTHIWNIVTNRESLWVRWVHMYKLKGCTIWDIPVKADMSWGWRKLLQIREFVKLFFWKKISNGKYTSLLFDRWNVQCPLINYLTPRDITNEGFTLKTCVADIVSNEGWLWPQSWLLKAPNLATVTVPNLVDTHVDLLQWRDSKGVLSMFFVRGAWEALRPRGTEVAWYHIVWFSHNIPRHAFNLWLVMRRSLKIQDRVRQWDVGPNVDLSMLRCKLCDAQPDSHEHLFFECPYSARIWILIRSLASMELISPRLHDIISYLQPIAHRRNARSVIDRILVAAAAYFIWVERNNRVFKNSRRSPEELHDAIIVTVRLKLLTFRFKNTTAVQDILARWKMPSSFRLYS
ncbi:putative RNA-directed DNA polymerase [Tanacetum coccineum]